MTDTTAHARPITHPTSIESVRLKANYVLDIAYSPTVAEVSSDITLMTGYIEIVSGFIRTVIDGRMSTPAAREADIVLQQAERLTKAVPAPDVVSCTRHVRKLASKAKELCARYEKLEGQ